MKVKVKQKKESNMMIPIIPLMLVISIVPLIVYMKVDKLTNEFLKQSWTSSTLIDLFTNYKGKWLIAFTIVGVIIFLSKFYKNEIKIKKTYINIFMIVYAAFVVLSSLLSDNVTISLFGIIGRYEGMFVLLSYVLIMFLAINLVNNDRQIIYILIGLAASATLIGIIGFFQYMNLDIFRTDFIKQFIYPYAYRNQNVSLPADKGVIYGTFAHSNYVGSYISLVFPLSIVLLLTVKNKTYKIIIGIFSCLMVLNLFGSHSRAGYFGTVASVVVIIFTLRKKILNYFIKEWKHAVAAVCALIIVLVGMNAITSGKLFNTTMNYSTTLYRDIKYAFSNNKDNDSANKLELKDININGKTTNLYFNNSQIKIVLEDNGITFKDENNNDLKINSVNNQINLLDSRYSNMPISLSKSGDVNIMTVKYNGIPINFAVLRDGFKFINQKGMLTDLKVVEKFGFEGKERIGSARGYIWSRSIPLLKDTILLGFGPDTYPIHFPQDDYIGKLISYDTIAMFVDKPHNMFLNIALSSGIISLIAFLGIIIMYFVSSIKLFYKNRFDDIYSSVGFGIFAGVIGYLVTGIFNDSVVSVAPVFWVLLGIGISINLRFAKENLNKENI